MDKSGYSAGIAQVSRLTWNTYSRGRPYSEASDPKMFQENLMVGAQYLKHNYEHYGNWKTALIAYNEGETITDRILKGERGLSPITQRYVAGVN